MSGIYSSIENYDGKQGNNVQSIKQFTFSDKLSTAFWTYKRGSTTSTPIIVPANQNSSVLINKDLTVNDIFYSICYVHEDNTGKITGDNLLNLEYRLDYLLDVFNLKIEHIYLESQIISSRTNTWFDSNNREKFNLLKDEIRKLRYEAE